MKKITLFASISESTYVSKFNYGYHASGDFAFRVPPIIISNGSTAATATTIFQSNADEIPNTHLTSFLRFPFTAFLPSFLPSFFHPSLVNRTACSLIVADPHLPSCYAFLVCPLLSCLKHRQTSTFASDP